MARLRTAATRAASHPALVGFAILLLACLAIGAIQGTKPFYSDAGYYWELSETFDYNGSFSFEHYQYFGIRGYSVPLTLYLVREVLGVVGLGPEAVVLVLNSVLFALIGGVLGPGLAEAAWPQRRWGLARRLLLGAVFLVFWRGYLNYPLSDFPALSGALLALFAVSRLDSPLWLGVGGLGAAYAFNARPAYLLLIPLVALVVAWNLWKGDGRPPPTSGRRLLCCGAFVLGLAIVTVPQMKLENLWDGGWSPVPGGTGLAGLQYTEGLKLQRYETFVGGPHPRMEYLDPHTDSIVAGLDENRVKSTGQYLEIFASHPLTIAGVFLRHVVNGLDERYSTPYVEELHPPLGDLLRLGGFVLVFLALFRLAWPRGRRSLGAARWRYPAVLLLACATSLPSAIETRFMLPAFVLASLLLLAPGWPNPVEAAAVGWRRYTTIAIACLAFAAYIALVASIVSGATHNLRLA